ncbi:porin [Alteromonas sp. ASW11-130]|uniref:porin n=1 Tax=Alteromonas sp. ASW11-130 TaxID=3015775 RepID=UPI0022428DB0|nr:porin [Alteromonas sp. ASW11-130]MCW8090262.1 porin [Alteromonas sp. ASW11-130]
MRKLFLLSAVALAVSSGAQAEVRINGFANLVTGITSNDDTLYGYDDDFSFDQQSLFAIQLSGDVNEKLTATGQLVARGENDYEVDFEWAYMTYAHTDNLSISAGRLRVPLFRYSASLDVGYSYHWVAPPQSVYGVVFNNIDGVRVDYNNFKGDLEYNFQFAYGNINPAFSVGGLPGNVEGNNAATATLEVAYGNFKARGVLGRGDFTFNLDALSPALSGLNQIDPALTDLVDVRDDTGVFTGLGLEYDNFDWFISGEITEITVDDSYYVDRVNYYVTAGVRLDKFTPFVTAEWTDAEDDIKFLDEVTNFPEPIRTQAATIITGLQQAFFDKGNTYSLGVRYDWDTNVALKADVTKYDSDLNDADDASLVRFAVNYVF